MQFSASFLLACASTMLLAPVAEAGSTTFVKYSNLGFSGHYNDITAMDESSGSCSSSQKSFSGSLSPLDEDLSVHIRGPISLKKFAVYTTSGSSKRKRDIHHKHVKRGNVKTVEVTETVWVTEDGGSSTASVSVANIQNKVLNQYHSTDVNTFTTSAAASSSTSSSSPASSSSSAPSASGSWTRSSFYDAAAGSANNVVFMNHLGASGVSGTWSSTFGNSLSFSDASGLKAASSNTVLLDTTLDSDKEVILFSGNKCDSSCGFYRSDIPAYKGWDGNYKIFAFNFKMPTATDSTSNNHDMPAVWLLNGKIPRTLQYGAESCSCWSTGCGELDLWEVITSGSSQLTNHLHDGQASDGSDKYDGSRWGGGGSPDYFDRPVDSYETFVAIFDGSNVYLKKVDNFNFDESISKDTVDSWISGTSSNAILV